MRRQDITTQEKLDALRDEGLTEHFQQALGAINSRLDPSRQISEEDALQELTNEQFLDCLDFLTARRRLATVSNILSKILLLDHSWRVKVAAVFCLWVVSTLALVLPQEPEASETGRKLDEINTAFNPNADPHKYETELLVYLWLISGGGSLLIVPLLITIPVAALNLIGALQRFNDISNPLRDLSIFSNPSHGSLNAASHVVDVDAANSSDAGREQTSEEGVTERSGLLENKK